MSAIAPADPDHGISWPNANQEAETHRTYEEKLAYLHRESARLADENRQLMTELEARMNAEIISGWRATKAELEQASAAPTTYPQPGSSGSNHVAGGSIDDAAAKGIQREGVTGALATDECQATTTNAKVSAEPGRPNGSALQRFTRAKESWLKDFSSEDRRTALVMFMNIVGTLTRPQVNPAKNAICEAFENALAYTRSLRSAPLAQEESP